ncbi:MAG: DUF4097 family beta strand repeat-containing protein [Acidobacteriota bacterium]
MNRLNHRPSVAWLGLGLLVLLAFFATTTGCAYDVSADGAAVERADIERRVLERTFPASVRLQNLAGEVEIVQGSGSETRVVAEIHAAGGSPSETQKLIDAMDWRESTRNGKAGWALSYPVDDHRKFSYPRGSGSFFNNSSTSTKYLGKKVTVTNRSRGPVLYANLRIEVPSGASLGVRNVVGGIDGDSLNADLDLDTGSGDITLGDVEGDLLADTGSGDVKVGSVRGDADVDTGSGDIDLARVEGETARFDTGSGDIRVAYGRVRQAEMDTGSGNITARDFDAEEINMDTGSGNIRLESPLNWARNVMADTGSGNVVIVADSNASFDLTSDQGSGNLRVEFGDAELIRDGRELVGAKRGDGHTRIDVDTGSGNVRLEPGR